MKALAAVVLIAMIATGLADSRPVVTVTGGQLRGLILPTGRAVFKGIPYARPPVEDLRWREPLPVAPWTGVRDATAFGAMCLQNPNALVPDAEQATSEDCLFLNVWTTEWPIRSRNPVIVRIPGGGNLAAGSSLPVFDGESLARRGVVVVTLNFRLGLFGFFSHPALTRESPHHSSGNQGLLDQLAALTWVRENIAAFGGDRNRVTVSGESGGAIDISALMTSRLAKALFHRAIAESGAVANASRPMSASGGPNFGQPLTLPVAEKRGEELSTRWGVRGAASVRELRAVAAATILSTQAGPPASAFGLAVDGYVLQRAPVDVFLAGQEQRIPLLIGSNLHERALGAPVPSDLAAAIQDAYGPIAVRARPLYGDATDPAYGTPTNQWMTDTQFRCPAVAEAIWHAAAGNVTFAYEFARLTPGRETLGVTHGSQISYTFGTIDRAGVVGGPPAQPNEVDRQISDTMQRYWINFVRTGDPNGRELPLWPRFDREARRYQAFTDAGPVTNQALRQPFCDLFMENVQRTWHVENARKP